jgi:23S rRNA pseudouridine955/2504/2580 synthase
MPPIPPFSVIKLALKCSSRYLVDTIMTEWRVNIREAGLLLPEAINLRIPSVPIGFVRQLCKKQRVVVNNVVVDASLTVEDKDRILIKSSDRWRQRLDLSPVQPAAILYEDRECLVINKPSGLAVHHAQGHDDNLTSRLQDFLHLRREMFRIAPVHRLDAGTSGAILFGKGKKAAGQLGRSLMAGGMSKRYLAVVEGVVGEAGELNTPVPAKGSMKRALTRFRPLTNNGCTSLIELELITGRRHQLRQQLSEAGWPIIGDHRYHQKSALTSGRLLLHCCFLAFPNPVNDNLVEIDCPLPESFVLEVKKLGSATRGLLEFIP